MKKFIICLLLVFSTIMLIGCSTIDKLTGHDKHESSNPVSASTGSSNEVWVSGYTRSDGTYVKGHYRTGANETKSDNWSTKGNTNPHTGKKGTKKNK